MSNKSPLCGKQKRLESDWGCFNCNFSFNGDLISDKAYGDNHSDGYLK